ncbi:hypothetical protein GALL_462630 [mine drainage metagenome]|uniref:Uncharacterized protein n=1 Tax=mine drainage metagenome TaxID=410659 RepID=A0A1J5PKP0_9ZZZZ
MRPIDYRNLTLVCESAIKDPQYAIFIDGKTIADLNDTGLVIRNIHGELFKDLPRQRIEWALAILDFAAR